MSGTTRTSADLDPRRRRILFRAWHRGIREMDLIMGRFADAAIGDLSDSDLTEFERLSDVPDPELYTWIAGQHPVPPDFDTALFRRLRTFNHGEPS